MSVGDPLLGLKIQQLLIEHNLENLVNFTNVNLWSEAKNKAALEAKFSEFIQLLGINASEGDQEKVSRRIVGMYIEERFKGLDYRNFPQISFLSNEFNYHEPVVAGNIAFQTTCEHHLLAINGCAAIAYRPHRVMVGLSKLNQILNFFANRPQLQERLTMQLYVVLQELLQTPDVALVIKARHDCMNINGMQNDKTWHQTTQFGGSFNKDIAFQSHLINSVG